MKVFAGVIAYNEEIFIEASLRSLYDYVDKIIVIDGSYWGPSEDKTVKIAQSIGPKVEVVSGTWRWRGTDHKHIQRSQYLSRMPKGMDNWCILHDADEVWDRENIKRLINYLQEADEHTMLFSYQWIHLFNDPWHKIVGTQWNMPRPVGTFRLVPGIRQFNHHIVGVDNVNFQKLPYPEKVILEDVMFYHYGQAASKEKMEFKSHFYFLRDSGFRKGYKISEWEQYRQDIFEPNWKVRMKQDNVSPYDGPHPDAIKPLIGTFWEKDKNEKTNRG